MTDAVDVLMIEVKHIGLERMKRPLYITYRCDRHDEMLEMLTQAGFEMVEEKLHERP